MMITLSLISQALLLPFRVNLIQWPIPIEIAIYLYFSIAMSLPIFYFETDVKRRRLNGYIPIEERHH
ncbi:hypothetical protein [Exiguobacterium himgiriensis]|uniref:hypothetical protein n=2 Tax=Exiguobacterium TaxID=33986 RepID=UPI0021AE4F2B|nr:hypothetical protein [Exiguobacterium himgiriensis]MCT4782687.1 hypothetical protein [Exiguobacterium himgiriensis]